MQILPLKFQEKQLIDRALSHFAGNKTHTAKALGISVKTLYNKLEEYKSLPQVDSQSFVYPEQEAIEAKSENIQKVALPTIDENNFKLKALIQEVELDSVKIEDLMSIYHQDYLNNEKSCLVKVEQLRTFKEWNKILCNKSLAEKYNELVKGNQRLKELLINRYLKQGAQQ